MRFHLFPFRTEKLSSLTPMVLHLSCGRVGSRLFKVRSQGLTFFCCFSAWRGGSAAPLRPSLLLRRSVLREAVVPDDGCDAGGVSWGACRTAVFNLFSAAGGACDVTGQAEICGTAIGSPALFYRSPILRSLCFCCEILITCRDGAGRPAESIEGSLTKNGHANKRWGAEEGALSQGMVKSQ